MHKLTLHLEISFSCMSFVERTLPIALARPFVEQFVPGGTKVSILDLS